MTGASYCRQRLAAGLRDRGQDVHVAAVSRTLRSQVVVRAELQSIITLDAMASDEPVVGAGARALPLLVHDGVDGHLFEPGDVAGLAHALVRILAGTVREQTGRESPRLTGTHDIDGTLDEFEDVYGALATARAVGHRPPSRSDAALAA